MANKPSAAPKPSGDQLAAVQLLGHASDVLEQRWRRESPLRGPRVPYIDFDPRERITEVLGMSSDEREAVAAMQGNEGLSQKVRERRVSRMTRGFRRQHLEAFVCRLLAQKLGLAAMQVHARNIMEQGMITEHGETLYDVLGRAASLNEGKTELLSNNAEPMRPKSDYAGLFPEGSFRIAEHRVTIRQLHELVDDFAEESRLPPHVISDYRTMYRSMVVQSRDVHAFRRDHPNDRALFRACLGFYPQGHIDIIQAPLGLYIRCHALEDYAKAYAGERNGVEEATACQMQRASLTGGVALGNRSRFPAAVRNGITLEQNDAEKLFLGERVGIYQHEQDHIYNRFFHASWMNAPTSFPPGRSANFEDTRTACRAYMRDALDVCRVLEVVPSGKDEMLAKFGEGDDLEAIRASLLQTGRDSLYDFIESHRRDIRATGATKASPFTVGKLMREHISEPYRRAVERAVEALRALEEMEFDRDVICELLRVEPMEKWPRLVRLISEYL